MALINFLLTLGTAKIIDDVVKPTAEARQKERLENERKRLKEERDKRMEARQAKKSAANFKDDV